MSSNLLSIATSALQVTQQALATTSHNIANVNTEGYSRQRVDAATRDPMFVGAGFVGTGVKTAAIQRSYDQFLETQLRSATSSLAEIDQYHLLASRIDNLVADPDVGISSALANFFNAVHDAASDPTSIPARQALLSESQTLTDRFHTLDARLQEIDRQVFSDLQTQTDTINSIASQIAALNQRIVAASSRPQASPPNDLLDQRNRLITQLAEKIHLTQVPHDNGAVSIFIGSGQALVQENEAAKLSVQPNALDPRRPEIVLETASMTSTITNQVKGGQLGGTLRFRNEVLEPTQAKLGLLATGLGLEFNRLHRLGFDLDGNTGQDFFTPLAIPVYQDGTGTIAVDYVNTSDLVPSDYLLEYDGANYTLTRLSDRTQTTLTSFPATIDGIQIDITAAPTGPSRFLIRPTAEAASNLQPALTDPRRFAAAEIDTSTGAIGANGIALDLAALESAKPMLGGKASFQDAYRQIVAEVGTLTRAAQISRAGQEALKQQAIQAREAVSGVNLDEEAANLVKFQQAYQAAAQVVTAAQQTFDALINAIRR